jgi:Rad3-related DNA helicase
MKDLRPMLSVIRTTTMAGWEKFFAYEYYKLNQRELGFELDKALKNNRNVVISAPTRGGKTNPAWAVSLFKYKKLFYATPYHNAMDTIDREARKVGVITAVFKGKKIMCLLAEQSNEKLRTPEDFHEYCRSQRHSLGCPFYQNISFWDRDEQTRILTNRAKYALNEVKKSIRKRSIGSKHIFDFVKDVSKSDDLCFYELMKALAKEADIVVGDYFYLLGNPGGFLEAVGVKKGEELSCGVIFDEAHCLDDRIEYLVGDTLHKEYVSEFFQDLEKKIEELKTYLTRPKEELNIEGQIRTEKPKTPVTVQKDSLYDTLLKSGQDEIVQKFEDVNETLKNYKEAFKALKLALLDFIESKRTKGGCEFAKEELIEFVDERLSKHDTDMSSIISTLNGFVEHLKEIVLTCRRLQGNTRYPKIRELHKKLTKFLNETDPETFHYIVHRTKEGFGIEFFPRNMSEAVLPIGQTFNELIGSTKGSVFISATLFYPQEFFAYLGIGSELKMINVSDIKCKIRIIINPFGKGVKKMWNDAKCLKDLGGTAQICENFCQDYGLNFNWFTTSSLGHRIVNRNPNIKTKFKSIFGREVQGVDLSGLTLITGVPYTPPQIKKKLQRESLSERLGEQIATKARIQNTLAKVIQASGRTFNQDYAIIVLNDERYGRDYADILTEKAGANYYELLPKYFQDASVEIKTTEDLRSELEKTYFEVSK